MSRALLLLALLCGGPPAGRNSATAAKWINSYAGPFIPVMGRWFDCPKTVHTENLVHLDLKISQHRNRLQDSQTTLQKLTGNVTVRTLLTNTGTMYMKAAVKSNNQWKENAHVLKFTDGICKSMMEHLPDFVRQVYKLDPSPKNYKSCNVQPGVYVVDNAPVNFTVPKLPIFPYGAWRVEIGFDLGTEAKPRNIMCFLAEIYTVPKL